MPKKASLKREEDIVVGISRTRRRNPPPPPPKVVPPSSAAVASAAAVVASSAISAQNDLERRLFDARDELLELYRQCKEKISNNTSNNSNKERTDPTTVGRVHDILDDLWKIRITRPLLEKTGAAKVVYKFAYKLDAEQFPTLTRRAKAVRLGMMSMIGATGEKDKELREYRSRVNELTQERQAKPDMVAYRELRNRKHRKEHGLIDDVPVGMTVKGRGEAAILGIHTNILSGIDAEKDTPCYAVCVSGKYHDDERAADSIDGEGIIIYTGAGGQNKELKQIEDQTEIVPNHSLILSNLTKDPVRMLRRVKGINYRYDGLYDCIDYTYEPSSDGPKVYKFSLKPRSNGQSLFSIRKDMHMRD